MRRILRLLPALIVTVLVFGVGAVALGLADPWPTFAYAAAALLYVSNWIRALNLYPLDQFAHTWTLSMEEQFYLVWPLLLLLLFRLGPRFKAAIAGVLILAALCQLVLYVSLNTEVPRGWISSSFPTRAGALFIGALSALLLRSGYLTGNKDALKAMSLPAALVVVAVAAWPENYFVWKQLVAVVSCAIVIISLAIDQRSTLASILETRALTFIGRISYGVYLYNFPIVWFFGATVYANPDASFLAKQAYGAFVLVPATILMSWASFKYVEKPFLSLKDRVKTDQQELLVPSFKR